MVKQGREVSPGRQKPKCGATRPTAPTAAKQAVAYLRGAAGRARQRLRDSGHTRIWATWTSHLDGQLALLRCNTRPRSRRQERANGTDWSSTRSRRSVAGHANHGSGCMEPRGSEWTGRRASHTCWQALMGAEARAADSSLAAHGASSPALVSMRSSLVADSCRRRRCSYNLRNRTMCLLQSDSCRSNADALPANSGADGEERAGCEAAAAAAQGQSVGRPCV